MEPSRSGTAGGPLHAASRRRRRVRSDAPTHWRVLSHLYSEHNLSFDIGLPARESFRSWALDVPSSFGSSHRQHHANRGSFAKLAFGFYPTTVQLGDMFHNRQP